MRPLQYSQIYRGVRTMHLIAMRANNESNALLRSSVLFPSLLSFSPRHEIFLKNIPKYIKMHIFYILFSLLLLNKNANYYNIEEKCKASTIVRTFSGHITIFRTFSLIFDNLERKLLLLTALARRSGFHLFKSFFWN